MKQCVRCGVDIQPRKKFCSDKCKFWFNLIKKEKEAHLPPAKKRNRNFFSMVTGYERALPKGGMRQGRRSGGMITGSMSAMINCTVEKWVELNAANLTTHFTSISFHRPTFIQLGDGTSVKEEDIKSETGINWIVED